MKLRLALAALSLASLRAEPENQALTKLDLVNSEWPAKWIACPGYPPRAPGVFHFRKKIVLAEVRPHFPVHVSADNRFILWVNRARVGEGPARGSPAHWRYETYDIGRLLHAGENLITATVWNFGTFAPKAQMSDRTGFMVQGDSALEADADTDGTWEVEEEKGRGLLDLSTSDLKAFYAAGPGEFLDARSYDWNWQLPSPGALSRWRAAVPVGEGEPGRRAGGFPWGVGMGGNPWILVPDSLPPMEYSDAAMGKVVRREGTDGTDSFPLAIPAHRRASLLLDHGAMTTAYPEMIVKGGRGAKIRITYAEALEDGNGLKGNRNEIAGRSIVGLHDAFIPDGGMDRAWQPLWWRSWRYLQLDIESRDDPLVIESMRAHFSAYPFLVRANFAAGDPTLDAIWNVGIRTARLNAHETYMDCPYWEQLQYIGDTRIQALVSYVVFGDDRLARQALHAFDESKVSEGLTQSRYPSAQTQFIPTFSLLWIGMLHDYWLYRPELDLLRELVPHTRSIIDWYIAHLRPDGLLGNMPWWNFADWADTFQPHGIPPLQSDGGSSVLTLHFLAALREAADLEGFLGHEELAQNYRRRAETVAGSVYRLCWDGGRGLLADNPARQYYSQEANALAVLLDVVPERDQKSVLERMLGAELGGADPGSQTHFSRASLYFRFYVARAVDHAGLADRYLELLGPWRRMLDLGLTTWAEKEEPTRSDDHAWSAHPNFDLLTLVAGIRPDAPGFRRVRIAPHLGRLTALAAAMPHPEGMIRVRYRRQGERWVVNVELPKGLTGTLAWHGRTVPLSEGASTLSLPP